MQKDKFDDHTIEKINELLEMGWKLVGIKNNRRTINVLLKNDKMKRTASISDKGELTFV